MLAWSGHNVQVFFQGTVPFDLQSPAPSRVVQGQPYHYA